jgi:hypothetical protein
MICDWITETMGKLRWRMVRHCLEIGAGAGYLMQEFIRRFPEIVFEGIELNEAAVVSARRQDLVIHQGILEDLDSQPYDIIYAIAVIEHVSSPTNFLKSIRQRLKVGGWLLLCQPTQDVASYDIFFRDHLYHFGTAHLRQYARKCGFREVECAIGHEWMPNFSLHLWQADEEVNDFDWVGPQEYTTCLPAAWQITTDMSDLDQTLTRLITDQRRVAVFGLNEVYWLARAYSSLNDFPLVCGLDDQPGKPEFVRLEFPVLVPEDCLSLGIQDVILTMNKVYYDQAYQRLKRLGLTGYPVLS